VKKKLHKKLQLKSETLRYLDHVRGGSAGPTCADTCSEPPGEPSVNGCTSGALPCATQGCGSGYPNCGPG
jgi:hypothetical protein